MPCYETRLTTVELAAADIEALGEALRKEGHSVTHYGDRISGETVDGYAYSFANGRFSTDLRSSIARNPNSTKRAYSREIVAREAKRGGWQARFVGDTFTLTKRRF